MNKRERYLKALRNQAVDEWVWAPNFDYWLAVNSAEKTLPEKYAGMSRNDIVRAVGGSIWNRAIGCRGVLDASVKDVWREKGGDQIHELTTPVGTIQEVYRETEKKTRSRFLAEHFVKNVEDLRVMQYVVEATRYEADYGPTQKALQETGDDGVVLNSYFCVPFLQVAKTDVGYINAFYMWTDHRKEVDSLVAAYHRSFLQGYEVLANGPADVIATGDNMDGTMISPAIFKEYAVPFYQEARRIISARGKIFEGHWCGQTQTLLPLVPECGLDVVEAIVTKPMADVTLERALELLDGKVVLQGGLPSVLVCKEGGTRDDFERYLEETILPLRGRRGFILGMSDNVPPNADFWRVERVAKALAA
ncbi:MAG: uroporphyrinogen decarboxylase family protein [Verrucomicrobiae bacterium]|nr:uroporphyrinogen decarboxylase family protein [Verrucomicrobiae bacterium]